MTADTTTDTRPHRLVDVADLQPGDVVLAWYPEDPFSWTVVTAERIPMSYAYGDVTYNTTITYESRTEYNANGLRKVAVR